jgi:hypothetical protein
MGMMDLAGWDIGVLGYWGNGEDLPVTPGWNKQYGCLGIPYYQRFVQFSIHKDSFLI